MIFPFYTIFLSDPILPDGAFSGGYVLIVALAIVAFFLIRFMNQVDNLVKQVTAMQVTQGVMKAEQGAMKKELDAVSSQIKTLSTDKIADEAIAKLLSMQGGTGGRHWPFKNNPEKE